MIFFGLFSCYQLLGLFYYNKIKYTFGHPFSIRSCGISHLFRIGCICLQIISYCLLFILNHQLSIIVCILVTSCCILPLNIIEPTKSIHQLSSLLLFWLLICFFNLCIFIQDLFSIHKIINLNDSVLCLTLELFMVINSVMIFILESLYWNPSQELVDYYHLNNWELASIRNILSHLTFTWMQPIVSHAFNSNLISIDDLPNIPKPSTCDITFEKLNRRWLKEVELTPSNSTPSLFKTILKEFGHNLVIGTSYAFTNTFVSLLQPLALQRLVQFFDDYLDEQSNPPPLIIGYFYATLMFLISIAKLIISNQCTSYQRRAGFVIQSSLTSMIYHKAVKLSPTVNKSAGNIVSHASMDVALARNCIECIQNFIEAMIELCLCLIPLYSFLGNAIWGSIIAAIIFIPFAILIELSISPTFYKLLKYRDERTSMMNEILISIKNIKLYAWETPMVKMLGDIRLNKELRAMKLIGIVYSISKFIWSCIPFFMIVSGFTFYIYANENSLTPAIVFPTLTLLNSISNPISNLPQLLIYAMQAQKSFGRLASFFLLDEIKDNVIRSTEPLTNGDTIISIKDSIFTWDLLRESQRNKKVQIVSRNKKKQNIALFIDDFQVKKGQLVCLVGKVGSGKTTLLRSILGEIDFQQHSPDSFVKVNGSISYCPQNPWLLNVSVKENILFGCKYDKEFYWKVIESCELQTCFNSLPDGDKSIVGERGVSLSGGQKSRISLARSIYSRSDIYLLDDTLASIDINIGKTISKNILGVNGLLQGKTVLLATTSISIFEKANQIVLLDNGKIVETGDLKSVDNGLKSNLFNLISELKHELKKEIEKPLEMKSSMMIKGRSLLSEISLNNSINSSAWDNESEVEYYSGDDESLQRYVSESYNVERVFTRDTMRAPKSIASFDHHYEDDESIASGYIRRTFHAIEEKSSGNIKSYVIMEFLKACNFSYVLTYVGLIAVIVLINTTRDYSLTYFSKQNDSKLVSRSHLITFFSLGIIECIMNLMASYGIWTFCIIDGVFKIHQKLVKSVLYSPMSFFETNPNGRILNRFTNDIRSLDKNIPIKLTDYVALNFNLIATVIVIILNIPIMFIVIMILSIIYNLVRIYFSPTSRELQRLESVLSSPLLSHIQESIDGIETLRAFKETDRFIFKNNKNIDLLIRVGLIKSASNRWLSIRLESVSSLVSFLSVIFAILTLNTPNPISPEFLGLMIAYASTLNSTLNSTVTLSTELQADIVTIERITQYFQLKSEVELLGDTVVGLLPKVWPQNGLIKFSNYTARYRNNFDPVLININCEIKPGSKISIVGKTGSGKSTLTLSLYRMIETIGGKIEIDGLDINDIELHELRSRLNIIPQGSQPVLGTIRQTIDPLGQFTEDQIWNALELVDLKNHFMNVIHFKQTTSTGLDIQVDADGYKLSVGQIQLLSLARAILNPSKILILDEATSYIDVNSVRVIRQIIKDKFSDSTILTIAHRFETIIDSDYVLMLNKGELIEFGPPQSLLQDKNSEFSEFCENGFSC